jgi:hypothetical protein
VIAKGQEDSTTAGDLQYGRWSLRPAPFYRPHLLTTVIRLVRKDSHV